MEEIVKIRNQKSEIRMGGMTDDATSVISFPDQNNTRVLRAKHFEFDRLFWKEDGRSVSLRSALISNFEFFPAA
jgi:hypothetical protein